MWLSTKPWFRKAAAISTLIAGFTVDFACNSVLGIDDFERSASECTPGSARCTGETPQSCDEIGQWIGTTPCSTVPGRHCVGGACVLDCAPGDVRCSDDV